MAEWGLDRGSNGPAADAWRRQQTAAPQTTARAVTGTEIADAIALGARDRDEMHESIAAKRAAT